MIHPSLCLFSLTSEIRFGPAQTRIRPVSGRDCFVTLWDGKAPKAAQPSPNPLDLRLPHTIEPKINVTRNLTYLNPAEKTDLSIVSALSLRACRVRLLQVN